MGDILKTYYCCKCGHPIQENNPHHIENNEIYCGDCAFINNLITAEELIEYFYFFIDASYIGIPIVKNGEVVFVSKSYIKYQNTKNERRTSEYRKWRKSVYERDNYTCQKCGQVGGKLNAHHIKHFATHKEERLEIKNGITLCEKCHKEIHKKVNEVA